MLLLRHGLNLPRFLRRPPGPASRRQDPLVLSPEEVKFGLTEMQFRDQLLVSRRKQILEEHFLADWDDLDQGSLAESGGTKRRRVRCYRTSSLKSG
jgi:hypothetical protein